MNQCALKRSLLMLSCIQVLHAYSTTECFKVPVVLSHINKSPRPGPRYDYGLDDIPDHVQVTLICPKQTDAIHIHYAKYSYPALPKDYCLDRNQKCSDKKPCFCCSKPASMICSQQLERYEDYCAGTRGSCTMDIPQVYFSNRDGCISYGCEDKKLCVSRWIDIDYTCTSDESGISVSTKDATTRLIPTVQTSQTWKNKTLKQSPPHPVLAKVREEKEAAATQRGLTTFTTASALSGGSLTYGLLILGLTLIGIITILMVALLFKFKKRKSKKRVDIYKIVEASPDHLDDNPAYQEIHSNEELLYMEENKNVYDEIPLKKTMTNVNTENVKSEYITVNCVDKQKNLAVKVKTA